jgi:hypothetical protein
VGGVGVDQVRIPAAAEQERDERGAVRIHRGGQRGAALLVARVGEGGMGGEQAVHGGLLAGADRGEEPDHRVGLGRGETAIHLGAQRAPAREAVLARDRELGLGEPSGAIRAVQLLEPVLGELLQVLEAGTIGKGHDAPPFHVPGVRDIGRKVVPSSLRSRWVRPFTRTVRRLAGRQRVY